MHIIYLIRVYIQNKELLQLNNKKTDALIKKRTDDMNRHFSKDKQMANKHTKQCSTSSVTKLMQIKITMRYYFKPTRMVRMKKQKQKTAVAGVSWSIVLYTKRCRV